MFEFLADAVQTAAPAAGAKPAGNPLMDMLPIILMVVVMIFIFSRSNKKQQQRRQMMIDKIVKGSKVMLNSGIYGTVVEVLEKDFVVEIAERVQVKVVKSGVANIEDEPVPAAKSAEDKK